MRKNNSRQTDIIKEGDTQDCPQCGNAIGIVAGSKEAICINCGFKDPCCE